MKLLVAILFLIGSLLPAHTAAAQTPTLTRGPYVQSTTRDSILIVWQTDLPGDSRVAYGESDFAQTVGDPAPVTTHVITLTGLSAGTTYQYRIETGEAALAQATFRTAPDANAPFDFVMIGDSGIGSQDQADVAAEMLLLDPDLMLHLGDVIYPSGQPEGFNPFFFEPYRNLLDHVPAFMSMGNHDYGTLGGAPYLDAFYLPANGPDGERYYSFDWSNAHFVALDLNQAYGSGSTMYDWLVADLSATTAVWKFVFFHQALYSSGPHGFEADILARRAALAPVFEQYNVDLVFAGHDHDYERTTVRRDYVPSSQGVTYIVSGGGGAGMYNVTPQPFTAVALSVHHTVQVRVYGCGLTVRAFDTTNTVIDQLVLVKCPLKFYLPIILKN